MPISDKMLDISLLMFNFTLIELSLLRENVRDEGADKRVLPLRCFLLYCGSI